MIHDGIEDLMEHRFEWQLGLYLEDTRSARDYFKANRPAEALDLLDAEFGGMALLLDEAIARRVKLPYLDIRELYLGLELYMQRRGIWQRKLDWGLALRDWREEHSTLLDIRLLNSIANAYAELRDYERAIPLYELLVERITPVAEVRPSLARIYNNLAACYRRTEQLEAAEGAVRSALDLHQGIEPDGWAATMTTMTLAQVLKTQGRLEDCLAVTRQAVQMADGLGDVYLQGEARGQLGAHLLRLGRYEEADAVFPEAMRLQQAINDEPAMALTYYNYALVCHNLGRKEQALGLFMRSLELFETYGMASEAAEARARADRLLAGG
jgi:tetratricopeptide (TPR) repeat protein